MIRLDSTTRKLEVLLSGVVATTQLAFMASWSDASASGYAGGSTPGLTNNTAAVDVVAAPSSGIIRDIDYVSVNNRDTAQAQVTFRYNAGGTPYEIISVLLAAGSQLVYTHADGWRVVDSTGSLKAGIIGSTGATGATGAAGPVGPAMLHDDQDDPGWSAIAYAGAGAALTTPVFTASIGVGGVTAANSGAGITFPATQAPSSNANTLDDYEEGTWTPSIAFGGGSTGVTYTTRQGSYVKIGKSVTAWMHIKLSSKGSSTGVATIAGLPFASDNDNDFYGSNVAYFGGTALVVTAGALVSATSTIISLYNLPGGFIQDTNCTDTAEFVIVATYKASA